MLCLSNSYDRDYRSVATIIQRSILNGLIFTSLNYSKEAVRDCSILVHLIEKPSWLRQFKGMVAKLIDYQMTRGIYDFYVISEADS